MVPRLGATASALRGRGRRAGFSIIELLVAIIIIIILVAVLLPLVQGRTAQARFARTTADLENIVEAEQRIAIDTGYYVRLMALNDTVGGTLAFQRPNPVNFVDGLGQYLVPGGFYQNPNLVLVDPTTSTLVDGTSLITNIGLTAETSLDPATIQWNGPYLNFTKDENLFAGSTIPDGIPDDAWGNNYVLFSRDGMVLEPDGVVTGSVNVNPTGGFSNGGPFDAAVFDRMTVLSLGPNGLPGDGSGSATTGAFGQGDDLVRSFGR